MDKALEVQVRRKAKQLGLRLVKDYGHPPLFGVVDRYVKFRGDHYNEIYIFTLEETDEYLDALAEEGFGIEDTLDRYRNRNKDN